MLSGRGLCDGLIPRREESYRVYVLNFVWSAALVTSHSYSEWVGGGRDKRERKKDVEEG